MTVSEVQKWTGYEVFTEVALTALRSSGIQPSNSGVSPTAFRRNECLAWLTVGWNWRQYVGTKHQYTCTGLQRVTSQKMVLVTEDWFLLANLWCPHTLVVVLPWPKCEGNCPRLVETAGRLGRDTLWSGTLAVHSHWIWETATGRQVN